MSVYELARGDSKESLLAARVIDRRRIAIELLE